MELDSFVASYAMPKQSLYRWHPILYLASFITMIFVSFIISYTALSDSKRLTSWPVLNNVASGMQVKTKLRIFLNIDSTTLPIIVKQSPVFLFYYIANEHWDKKAAVITGSVPTLEHFGSGPKKKQTRA